MENPLSRKALRLLCSPLSLVAMAVLLVNDHLLRRFWPSWVTGKLGDFAWLLFFPFALAWVWALLLPRREGWVRGLAFGITGGIFALAKTVPACHAAVVSAAEWALGSPVMSVRDPSDLVALVSLAAGWAMWEKAPNGKGHASEALAESLPRAVARRRQLALAAAALLTVANMVRFNVFGGVERLSLREEGIFSLVEGEGYVSRDGGLSWLKAEYGASERTYPATVEPAPHILDVNGTVQYRYASGKPIERSEDGGVTWQEEYVRWDSPADEIYYKRQYQISAFFPGPLDAVADPETGNVIFAMGAEGVLVRTPDGAWMWAEVGRARRVEFRRGEGLLLVLRGELLLAAGFGLLVIMTLLTRWRRSLERKVFLGIYWLLWLLWGLSVVVFPDPEKWGYSESIDLLLMPAGCIFLLIHIGVELALILPKQATVREMGQVALTGLVAATVFLIPHILWVLTVVPWHELATGLGTALGVGVMVVAWGWGVRQDSRQH